MPKVKPAKKPCITDIREVDPPRPDPDSLEGLREENLFLRAMLHTCLRCGQSVDDMTLVQVCMDVIDGREDERQPGARRFHASVSLGGAIVHGDNTQAKALKGLRRTFLADMAREFDRSAKNPRKGLFGTGRPDRAVSPAVEARQLLKELHGQVAKVEKQFKALRKHTSWGAERRITGLRERVQELQIEVKRYKNPPRGKSACEGCEDC